MNIQKPNPRARAVQILQQVLDKNQLMEEILNDCLQGLEERDRALARAIASTVLRNLGTLDTLIARMTDRPLPAKATTIHHILRIGMAQILFLKIPSHAAVNDTVDLVPQNSKFRGLVNAILRRTDRGGSKHLANIDIPVVNNPEWLWESWCAAYGEETARRIAAAHLIEAPLDISVTEDVEGWATKLYATVMPTGSLRRKAGGSVPKLPGFDEGKWWVQDFSASLPAKLFGDIDGKNILDICAAPGGKTAQLAAAGATVTALDRSKVRLERLQENMERLDLTVTTVVADATGYKPAAQAEAILLDAPCSSTGTIRRHPDVAWLKRPLDVKKLADLQSRLLDATIDQLSEGGTLVYSTCSLQPEEGEEQIEAFLERHPEMQRVPVTANEVGELAEIINDKGDIRCLPCHMKGDDKTEQGGMDGFFASRLIKRTAPAS